jgi:hypothetical protein
MDIDRIEQIYELIKHNKSDVSVDEAVFAYHYVFKNPIITKAESDINPMIDFVKLHPDLMWFIDSQRVSGVGQENGKVIREKYPNLTLDEFLAMMMLAWKEILTEFVASHGYKT